MHKEKKSKQKTQAQVFSVNFAGFLRTPFFKNILVAASEDEHDETKLLHMTSQLNKCYQNGHAVTFFCSRPKVKMRQN